MNERDMAVLRTVSQPFLPDRRTVGLVMIGMCVGLVAALPFAIFIVRVGL